MALTIIDDSYSVLDSVGLFNISQTGANLTFNLYAGLLNDNTQGLEEVFNKTIEYEIVSANDTITLPDDMDFDEQWLNDTTWCSVSLSNPFQSTSEDKKYKEIYITCSENEYYVGRRCRIYLKYKNKKSSKYLEIQQSGKIKGIPYFMINPYWYTPETSREEEEMIVVGGEYAIPGDIYLFRSPTYVAPYSFSRSGSQNVFLPALTIPVEAYKFSDLIFVIKEDKSDPNTFSDMQISPTTFDNKFSYIEGTRFSGSRFQADSANINGCYVTDITNTGLISLSNKTQIEQPELGDYIYIYTCSGNYYTIRGIFRIPTLTTSGTTKYSYSSSDYGYIGLYNFFGSLDDEEEELEEFDGNL